MSLTTLFRDHPVQAADNTGLAVAWDRAGLLLAGSWSLSAPTRLIGPAGVGRVKLAAGVAFEPDVNGMRQLYARKNGSEVRAVGYPDGYLSHTQNGGYTNGSSCSFTAASAWMAVEEGDYFELFAYQTAGRALWVGAPLPINGGTPEGPALGCLYFQGEFA